MANLTAAAAICVAVLVGCGSTGEVEHSARNTTCLAFPLNETSGLTPEYYAAVPAGGTPGKVRYYAEHEDDALRELRECGLDGERSRYSASDIEEMRELIMATPPKEWGDDPLFTFSVNPEDDIFEIRGRLDEEFLAELLDGYMYRYVHIDDGVSRGG